MLELDKLEDHLADNDNNILRIESVSPKQRSQYVLFQETRAYIRNLLDCLDEKVPEIVRLEEEFVGLLKNRADFLMRRRRQDVKDQFEECGALASGNAHALQQDAEKMMRAAEREARRSVAWLSYGGLGSVVEQDEDKHAKRPSLVSLITTVFPVTTKKRPVDWRHSLQKRVGRTTGGSVWMRGRETSSAPLQRNWWDSASKLFENSWDEYCRLSEIVDRFGEWLSKDRSSYEEAFIGICLVKVVGPIVRLQLLEHCWNPLEVVSLLISNSPTLVGE